MVERAVERLVEDERLRGGLTDAGYGPLLAWAIDELVRRGQVLGAAPTAGRTIDDLATTIREALRGLVRAAETGDGLAAADALRPDQVASSAAIARVAHLRFGPDPDENARRIAAALHETGAGTQA